LSPLSSFFLLSVRSLLGAVAVTPPKKKKKTCHQGQEEQQGQMAKLVENEADCSVPDGE